MLQQKTTGSEAGRTQEYLYLAFFPLHSQIGTYKFFQFYIQ